MLHMGINELVLRFMTHIKPLFHQAGRFCISQRNFGAFGQTVTCSEEWLLSGFSTVKVWLVDGYANSCTAVLPPSQRKSLTHLAELTRTGRLLLDPALGGWQRLPCWGFAFSLWNDWWWKWIESYQERKKQKAEGLKMSSFMQIDNFSWRAYFYYSSDLLQLQLQSIMFSLQFMERLL